MFRDVFATENYDSYLNFINFISLKHGPLEQIKDKDDHSLCKPYAKHQELFKEHLKAKGARDVVVKTTQKPIMPKQTVDFIRRSKCPYLK